MTPLTILLHAASVVYCLLAATASMVLLSLGGRTVYTTLMIRDELLSRPSGVILLLLGALLLASVALTAIWSSAGLLAMALPALVTTVLAVVPSLLWEVYAASSGLLPPSAVDSLAYGVAQVAFTLLAATGAVAAISRRRPSGSVLLGVVGLVIVPSAQLVGLAMVVTGMALGTLRSLQTLQPSIGPVPTVLVLGGLLVLLVATLLVQLSPYALILPGLILLGLSALPLVPGGAETLLTAAPGLPPEVAPAVMAFLIFGGGSATGLLLLSTTAALAVVRTRARSRIRRQDAALAPAVQDAPAVPGEDPLR